MSTVPTTYGFIGLGQMGHGMAKNLRLKISSSNKLFIYDIDPAAVQRFVSEFGDGGNVVATSSPKEVAEYSVLSPSILFSSVYLSDVILTSLPRAPHVDQVFNNPTTGLLAAPKTGKTLFLELSTIDAKVSGDIGHRVIEEGYGQFVDAPCSGGSMGAEKGVLSFMVGCDAELYPRVFEILRQMGKEDGIFHCGASGTGLKTKLLNNYLSSITTIATAETINIGIRGGLDAKKLNDVLNASSGMNFNSKVNNPVPGLTPGSPASNGYIPGFSIELCLGVLELAVKSANELGAKMVLGPPMLDAYRAAAREERFHGKDAKVIYRWIEGDGF
ncbi:uncharacterized protein ATNIH1004_001718 [Aspergillus tanneri]|uniref:3-hydroxyisobutyrate dehydrogenase n=1 Tax=Aspergillus tanneri TaxID=1220188 RepID=A0A5M9N092_9EURO|nr:uncharacterized protein ATNIH1004_001718 [Aspergillus tanneri]KAA8652811.1 hypothetical protein ATNIH1004_001718 [Aspergillus tanneri]